MNNIIHIQYTHAHMRTATCSHLLDKPHANAMLIKPTNSAYLLKEQLIVHDGQEFQVYYTYNTANNIHTITLIRLFFTIKQPVHVCSKGP